MASDNPKRLPMEEIEKMREEIEQEIKKLEEAMENPRPRVFSCCGRTFDSKWRTEPYVTEICFICQWTGFLNSFSEEKPLLQSPDTKWS